MSINIKQKNRRNLEIYENNRYKRNISLDSDIIDFDFDDRYCAVLLKKEARIYKSSGDLKQIISHQGTKIKIRGDYFYINENGRENKYAILDSSNSSASYNDAAYDAGRKIGNIIIMIIIILVKLIFRLIVAIYGWIKGKVQEKNKK